MRLIDADKLKKSTCDKGVCSDCEDFHKGTNVSTNCSEVRWYFLEKINEQPTMDAIPIEWIEQYLYDLSVGNEKHLINVGEILSMSDEEYYLKHLINRWKAEQEKQSD